MGERARKGALAEADVAHLREELDSMAAKGTLPRELAGLRAELDALAVPAPKALPKERA